MLEVKALNKAFGQLRVTRDVHINVPKGERRVILGPNGAGKTTLFNLLVGELTPDSGDILFDGQSIGALNVEARAKLGMSRSYQKNNLFEMLSVRENLALAAASGLGLTASPWSDTHNHSSVKKVVEDIACKVNLTNVLDEPVDNAPYGHRRQLEVGIALAVGPKLILMDEPTSGVGPEMVEGFHRLLHSLPRDLTVIIIEHDLDLAFNIADRITVLNYGEVVFEGTPEETRNSSLVNEIYLGDWAADA